MESPAKMLLLKFLDEQAFKVPFAEWWADNSVDPHARFCVWPLRVGESVVFGGGAAPVLTITVLS